MIELCKSSLDVLISSGNEKKQAPNHKESLGTYLLSHALKNTLTECNLPIPEPQNHTFGGKIIRQSTLVDNIISFEYT
jgi:hypothetical protein